MGTYTLNFMFTTFNFFFFKEQHSTLNIELSPKVNIKFFIVGGI